MTAGPFPLDEQFVRRDITEGYPGHPLRLGLRVIDGSCQAMPGAAVELWHADATGDYSAFADGGGGKDEGPGTTFLRGTQVTGDDGIVEFLTIYPGWYRGRAVHIHLRVHVDDTTILTSQLFFDEDYTASVYAEAPYAENGLPDTTNAQDGIAGDPESEGTLVHLTAAEPTSGAGTLGLLNLGVDPAAVSQGGSQGLPSRPGG
jgi:protocatechuate 3,4-dioxygenase beta subunit